MACEIMEIHRESQEIRDYSLVGKEAALSLEKGLAEVLRLDIEDSTYDRHCLRKCIISTLISH